MQRSVREGARDRLDVGAREQQIQVNGVGAGAREEGLGESDLGAFRERDLGAFDGLRQPRQRARIGANDVGRCAEAARDELAQCRVDVIAAEVRVAAARAHLEEPFVAIEDRHIERSAAEIVDEHAFLAARVIVHRGGRWLVHETLDRDARDLTGVARRGALEIVEVRGDGDHRAYGPPAEGSLRPIEQRAEDQRRDLGR